MKLKHKWVKLFSDNMCCSECGLMKQPPSSVVHHSGKWWYWYPGGRKGREIDKTYCYKRNEKTNI